jgi:hypothetical protein
LDGSINNRAYKLIKEWAKQHSDELQKNWTLLLEGRALKRILPLDGKPIKRAYHLEPVEIANLKKVQPLPDFKLNLIFMDGFSGIVDLKKSNFLLGNLKDPDYFAKGTCKDHNAHWPNNFDLDPTSLYVLLAYQKKKLDEVRYSSIFIKNWIEELKSK